MFQTMFKKMFWPKFDDDVSNFVTKSAKNGQIRGEFQNLVSNYQRMIS